MNTIGIELCNFLCDEFGLTFGKDFFYMRVPDESGPVFWMTQVGSLIDRDLRTKQKIKEYQFLLSYRNTSAQKVDEEIFRIETIINRMSCVKLEHFDLYDIRTSNLGSYEDVDMEGRFKGTLQIVVRIHDDYSDDYSE